MIHWCICVAQKKLDRENKPPCGQCFCYKRKRFEPRSRVRNHNFSGFLNLVKGYDHSFSGLKITLSPTLDNELVGIEQEEEEEEEFAV